MCFNWVIGIQADPVVARAGQQLSNSWTLIGLTLCAELFFILAVSIPYTTKVNLREIVALLQAPV